MPRKPKGKILIKWFPAACYSTSLSIEIISPLLRTIKCFIPTTLCITWKSNSFSNNDARAVGQSMSDFVCQEPSVDGGSWVSMRQRMPVEPALVFYFFWNIDNKTNIPSWHISTNVVKDSLEMIIFRFKYMYLTVIQLYRSGYSSLRTRQVPITLTGLNTLLLTHCNLVSIECERINLSCSLLKCQPLNMQFIQIWWGYCF